MEIAYPPIGIIRSLFAKGSGTAIQPAAAAGAVGRIALELMPFKDTRPRNGMPSGGRDAPMPSAFR